VGKVLCSISKSQFSIEHGSHCEILQHIKKRKHAIAEETESYSKRLTSYFTKETTTDECKDAAAEEELFAFHTVKQPFLSIHGLHILSNKKMARREVFMWLNKI
jgi:hypothetical protein